MKTVIEVEYKEYTENVIVTYENEDEVITMLATDKSILDFIVIIEGDVNFWDETVESLLDKTKGKNVGIVRRLTNTLHEMEKVNWWKTDLIANRHFEKIENLQSNIAKRTSELNNIEKLFI